MVQDESIILHEDFLGPQHTVVISDLHLADAEPDHPGSLWKKFKTRQFFFDQVFADFLSHIEEKTNYEKVELILNGDIFDFDSVGILPENPPYRVSWLEKARGLHPEEMKSVFKIKTILQDHTVWMEALKEFIQHGNSVVFIVGNHDLELHFFDVQKEILRQLNIPQEFKKNVKFCSWFYISNGDTLVEHGNQYDPYCLCQDPVNPRVRKRNRVQVRLPFGNLASRYMINGMGYFNPHVDTNYIMTITEYLHFFFKYLIRNQPFIVWTWFWGAFLTFVQSFFDRLLPEIKDPLTVEDRVEYIAHASNATPRMVRELKELFAYPAASNPIMIARELWLDRALLMLLGFLLIFQFFTIIKLMFSVSFFWMFIPIALFVPFFIFYSKSISSSVHKYKEPNEKILTLSSQITGVSRIIYGHTHIYRHEMIGPVEHLNSGCWSPAFLDVECTRPFGKKTFIWIRPSKSGTRTAHLLEFKEGRSQDVFRRSQRDNAA